MANLSLTTGLRALLSAQRVLDTIGHNVANANTPGYSRQRVQLDSGLALQRGGMLVGSGVDASRVDRSVDSLLARRIMAQRGVMGGLGTRISTLSEIESFFGEPGPGGVGQLFDGFFSAASELSTTPRGLGAPQRPAAERPVPGRPPAPGRRTDAARPARHGGPDRRAARRGQRHGCRDRGAERRDLRSQRLRLAGQRPDGPARPPDRPAVRAGRPDDRRAPGRQPAGPGLGQRPGRPGTGARDDRRDERDRRGGAADRRLDGIGPGRQRLDRRAARDGPGVRPRPALAAGRGHAPARAGRQPRPLDRRAGGRPRSRC